MHHSTVIHRATLASFILLGSWTNLGAQTSPSDEQFFENEVRPLLVEKCHECHSDKLQESGLRLDSRAGILSGGITGPAAIAADVDSSAILQAVRGDGDYEPMPPENPLTTDQIQVLQEWVRRGLPWTAESTPAPVALGDQPAIRKAAISHWAFQTILHPEPPSIEPSSRTRIANPIDAFVADRLHREGLSQSDMADRRTLIRRIHFDVIGLPPNMETVTSLMTDSRPTEVVLSELVDELLASKQYGERWARYWLDLARYADTQDWQAQADVRYPFAYTYRDYVIASLNDDKPYDEFLREQIAADFYFKDEHAPELAALGFLTVGPRFRNNRLEVTADQIDVVCRGLMGITVSCARCHDHKYDPIPIEDYYSLYGVFASSDIPETFPTIQSSSVDPPLLADYHQKLAVKLKDLSDYKESLRDEAVADLRERLPVYLDGFAQMSLFKTAEIRGLVSKSKVKEIAMTPLNDLLAKRLQSKIDVNDAVLKPWAKGLSVAEPVYQRQSKAWLDSWLADESIDPHVRKQLELDRPGTRSDLVKSYARVFDACLKEPVDSSSESIRSRLEDDGGWFDLDVEAVATASRLLGKGRKVLGDLQKAIGEVEATHAGSPPRAMVVQDVDSPITPFVMLRGEPQRRGERVDRQFISLLAGDERKPFRDGSGRRELAEAITDPANPLTTRVLVNRVWSKYFGRGLVESLDDFGLRSDPPSHPEMLDWMSHEFIAHGQSLKWLHKTILTSQTYLQSSNANDSAWAIDPENRLLWRQNRRRLDFEAMRDAMLVVSKTLDPQLGGRSVHLSAEPMTTRRSLYAYIDRVELDPMLRTFDFASPTASASSRAETMIPQQALFSMNHPFVAAQARAIAELSLGDDDQDRIQALYHEVFQRAARPNELRIASEFLQQARPGDAESASDWQYGFGEVEATGRADYELKRFPHWTGTTYQGGPEHPDPVLKFLSQSASGGHPGNLESMGSVRRFVAPDSGEVRITGRLIHTRPKSDGVFASIRSIDLDKSYHAMRSEVETTVEQVSLARGDVIDFVVSPGKTPSADTYVWDVNIEGIGGGLLGRSWDSEADFHGPPPPPLSPLAQLAQALLLTNEFLYLD